MENINAILTPVVTEKATENQALGKYTFYVAQNATKIDVKNAVKQLFGIDVDTVRIVSLPKKTRQLGRGRIMTKRTKTKKAIVQTKDKKPLDFNKTTKAK